MKEFKIIEEKENLLFNRNEIKGCIDSETVPSRVEILEILSKKFKVPLENIKIKKISGKFGSNTFNVEANIYSSEKDKESIELKKKKEKAQEKKEEVVEEKQPEVQQEPAEKESPKEEPESQENPEPQGEAKEQ
ncbi:MAG TPA: hypothetical protein VMV95_03450 [Bacillota bacterium]|nr:hypothetical protein [Bacillota bacterium]